MAHRHTATGTLPEGLGPNRTRITYHPELFGQRLIVHDQPAPPPGRPEKPKPISEERAADLVDFRQAHGKFPRGYLEGEGSLYIFLQSQRGRYRAGKLLKSRKPLSG